MTGWSEGGVLSNECLLAEASGSGAVGRPFDRDHRGVIAAAYACHRDSRLSSAGFTSYSASTPPCCSGVDDEFNLLVT
jgi:hypothetical protein